MADYIHAGRESSKWILEHIKKDITSSRRIEDDNKEGEEVQQVEHENPNNTESTVPEETTNNDPS